MVANPVRCTTSKSRSIFNACWVLILMISQSPSLSRADDLQSTARPLGVYAKVDVEAAISGFTNSASPSTAELHGLVRTLYADLLANPAISGITVGQHWDHIEPYDPTNSPAGSDGYDWSYLDDAFAEANAANKSVQLIITPGVDSPPWLLLTNICSCDGLFTNSGIAPTNCGTVTFTNFPEVQHSDGSVMPLPWNLVYKAAWQDFLIHLNARYGFNPAFVSIAVAGPICGSPEMILPTTAFGSTQISGTNADDAWNILITNSFPSISEYRNTDQVFIDQWEQTIEMYEQIFAGVTLCLSPDAGDQFPFTNHIVKPHSDNVLYAMDCLASINSTKKNTNLYQDCLPCEAKTEILSYFATVEGPNGKSTRVGGMTASSSDTLLTGDIGIAGVKLLTSLMPPSPPFRGGAEFDHPVSGDQKEGCLDPANTNCRPTTVEAAYHILTVFFNQTPAAGFYNGTVGTNYIQYLEIPYVDVEYAETNWCPDTNSPTLGSTSLQDLLNRASHDLFAMAGLQLPLPPPTCHSVGPLATSGTQGQFSFTTNSDGASVTITSYTGGGGALTIPGTLGALGGLPVTGIGTNAFAGDAMTAVTMPDSLVSIGDGAFAYCFALTNVSIPDSVTNIGTNSFGGCIELTAINVDTNNPAYDSVGGVLFNKSQTALIQYPGGLGRSYTIPKGVTTIGDAAFDFCQNLRSVTIPKSVTSIGNNAFEDCFNLANVTIGSGVITIGADAFDYCQSLTNITIPDSVSSIGDGAFEDCASLTNVTIGSGVTSIGDSPFEYCGSLAVINVDMGNTFYSSLDGVLFDKSQTTLIEYPAGNLATSYTIPNSVTTIGDSAFEYCGSLTIVIIPNSVASIGADAFNNTSLTNVTIPNSVTSLGARSFEYCPLTSVIIGSGVTNIGEQEFSGCSSLTSLTIPNSVTSIGDEAFLDCTSLTNVTIPNSVSSIGDDAFEDCASLTNVTISSGVTSIGDSPFEYCGSLAAINVNRGNIFYSSLDGVLFDKSQTTLIEYPAGNLATSYKIPKGVITIGDSAFFRSGLTNVTIPNSVTNIGEGAFEDCFSLANVTIGSGVTTIGDSAFEYCSSLTSITIPNSVASIGADAFNKTGLTSVTIPNSVTSLGPRSFEYCPLTSVIIGSGVTNIGEDEFSGCTSLTNVTIGSGVTTIGDSAFEYCSSLTSVTIPNSVTSIGDEAFLDCTNLTNVTIGSGVTTIGDDAFANCPLNTAIIPNSVTSIGDYAFVSCLNLASVYMEGSAPSLGGTNVFVYDNNVTVYYLPGTTGWGTNFAGVPTALWTPQVLTSDSSFGVQTNQFGFDVTWADGMSVVVEASTDLANHVWSPLATNTINGGSYYFSDPQWTNFPNRFYRIRSP